MKDVTTLLNDEARLHAFVDGRLDAAERAQVQARLADDPAAAALVRQWQEQRAALRGLHAGLLDEPVPAALLAAAQQLDRSSSRLGRWQRWGGMAASLALAFGIGWGSHGQWRERQELAQPAAARARLAGTFGQEALAAHAVFAPEVRHPVEVEAQQQEHLVQWLSRRLNRPLKVPDLRSQGYELVGGRLLPGEKGARAQFMYQNARGERITLYLGALEAGGGPAAETAFRFASQGEVASFYWVDQGFGYALAGKLPRSSLQLLSESVYRQL